MITTLLFITLTALPTFASSAGTDRVDTFSYDLTSTPVGISALIIFIAAYLIVMFEEKLHLRKSKPVLVAAGVIWMMVAVTFNIMGDTHTVPEAIEDNLLEFTELFLFLLVAMTYINSMEERNVFQRLRIWLVCKGFSLRTVFWVTGVLAFFMSPVADNLTTALIMGAVAMAVGGSNTKFITLACINIVVAANAGGAFSPFGDITTLMVWQKGVVEFHEFLAIFIPSVINWLIPAVIMNFAIGKEPPEEVCEILCLKIGAKRIVTLFLITIVTAVTFHNYLNLPPACGMMLGLGYLGFFSFWLKKKELRMEEYDPVLGSRNGDLPQRDVQNVSHFSIMRNVSRAEWDTLLFFYGIILCVGGLSQFGYLSEVSAFLYDDMGATFANVMVGILSAVVDNIPVMYAVLTMQPEMAHGQWLLVTLTAGVGGSMLSIGSAAGVALMGSARDIYTFGAHLKWTWAIALGYAASIFCHLWINSGHF
jgi:Na+/H+ antiporter NhaD/arsenite permease-like protein